MAYLALYRKYRPRDFDHVVGQEYVTRILKNQILSGRVGHAYLFSGIRGTGKTSVAKIFARAINCEHNTDGNPCNVCETCLNIERSGVMDIIEIDGASNRGVDEIREIREKVKYPPTMGKYKVYIIDEVHMLTKEAFNALLKTLEEPPEHIVFILATTEPNKLPMTILSRCQRFDIKPISQELIVGQMQTILKDIQVEIDAEALDFIAYKGDSSMRDALSLLDQVIDIRDGDRAISYEEVLNFIGMVKEEQIRELVEKILQNDKAGVLLIFKAMRESGKDSSLVFGQLIEFLRQVLIVKTTGQASRDILRMTESTFKKLKVLGDEASDKRFYEMIDFLIEEKGKLKYSGLAAVIVEMSLLKLCEPESFREDVRDQRGREEVQSMPSFSTMSETTQKVPPKQEVSKPDTVVTVEEKPLQRVPEATKKRTESLVIEIQAEEATILPESGKDTRPVNTDKLYTALVQVCQREKKLLERALLKGRLTQKGNKKLTLRFNPDKEGEAAAGMLNIPGMLDYLESAIRTMMKDNAYSIDVEIAAKNYEEMTDFEKTKSIINDERVEIIEVDN